MPYPREIIDPAVLRFFLLAMRRSPDGRYVAPYQGGRNCFDVAETPVRDPAPSSTHGGRLSVEFALAGKTDRASS